MINLMGGGINPAYAQNTWMQRAVGQLPAMNAANFNPNAIQNALGAQNAFQQWGSQTPPPPPVAPTPFGATRPPVFPGMNESFLMYNPQGQQQAYSGMTPADIQKMLAQGYSMGIPQGGGAYGGNYDANTMAVMASMMNKMQTPSYFTSPGGGLIQSSNPADIAKLQGLGYQQPRVPTQPIAPNRNWWQRR